MPGYGNILKKNKKSLHLNQDRYLYVYTGAFLNLKHVYENREVTHIEHILCNKAYSSIIVVLVI